MKYFVVIGTFKNPNAVDKTALERVIEDHKAHLQKEFDKGNILLSGPKSYGGGGVIVMKAASLEDVEKYLSTDPLKTSGVQEYEIIEFKLHDCQQMLRSWFD